jgi:hypothetical protein
MNRNSSRSSSGKKKFGKNLTKVTKAPAPPNPSTVAGAGANSSARNGLLLLSTKRASASGGLLSSKSTTASPSKPLQPLGLTTESYSSAHDALLGAVIGASRMTDTQQPPDAWGVAEKQTSSAPEPALAPKGGVSSGVSSYHKAEESHVAVASTERKESATTTESNVAARERAEQRRAEEEMRFNEQKERAAERLRQLERKMSNEKTTAPVPVIVTQRGPSDSSGEPSVLKTLNRDPNGRVETDDNGGSAERAPTRPRTLFDPNRPYSSLVGGGKAKEETEGAKDEGSPDQEYSRNNSVPHGARSGSGVREEEQQEQPVIHISNYETRDRGERNNNAGPRMLFDPKSGSMVAAPSREESAGGRGKKAKPKGRKERAAARDSGDDDNGTGKPKRGRGRKDERRDRKRLEDGDATPKDDSYNKKRGGAKLKPAENRLPRTCGVLYKRDEQGNCVCVDECEGGDQGYGAHSVPGGRVRNPIEYSKFVAQEKAYQHEGVNGLAYGVAGYDDDQAYGGDQAYYSGRDASFASPKQEPELVQKEIDWVKPDEKIELVTGADSPTLQATASTWVPSQAALAAAAAAKEEVGSETVSPVPKTAASDAEESEEDDDEHPVSVVTVDFSPGLLRCLSILLIVASFY